jgi:hypothetical protein
MTRKAFFAAFVIDEETYTPEPGPVDRHFVVSDLAQSSFGEQPGVSNFIVWDTIANLIAEHRQQGPITADYLTDERPSARETFANTLETCPSTHWNRGDDSCAECGADLNPATSTQPEGSCTVARPSFRDHLSPTMRTAQAFEYYEVRPCIERDRQIASYADEDNYAADLTAAQRSGQEFRTFWSLYGIDAGAHIAIGDFISKDAAHEVMNAILAIPAAARNAVNAVRPVRSADSSVIETAASQAADWLDDMINQSSNEQRI